MDFERAASSSGRPAGADHRVAASPDMPSAADMSSAAAGTTCSPRTKQLHRLHNLLHSPDWTGRPMRRQPGHRSWPGRAAHPGHPPSTARRRFPAATQVFRITHQRTDRDSGKQQTHTWAGVTDPGPDQATPAQIAESSHGTDTSNIDRTRSATSPTPKTTPNTAPHAKATPRNLAISALRLTTATNTAQAPRSISRHTTPPTHTARNPHPANTNPTSTEPPTTPGGRPRSQSIGEG